MECWGFGAITPTLQHSITPTPTRAAKSSEPMPATPSWFKIRAADKPSDPVQILIYDQIGRNDVTSEGA